MIIVGIGLAAFGIVLILSATPALVRKITWPTVVGRIRTAKAKAHYPSGDSAIYTFIKTETTDKHMDAKVDLEYEYTVDNVNYTGHGRVVVGLIEGTLNLKESEVEQINKAEEQKLELTYGKGDRLLIRFNRRNPARSEPVESEPSVPIGVGFLILVWGIFCFT